MKNISTPLVAVFGFLGFIVLTGLAFIGMYVSAANTGNRYENNIEASFQQSQNVLGQLAPKLREALGVTKLQTSAVRDVITAANSSRYGEGGTSATVQFIQEQNPNLDQAGYQRVINMIEASRNDFNSAQQETIDKNRAYKTVLGNMPGSFFLRLAGYPTSTYLSKKYDNVVMSGHAAGAFETRRDDGVNLNGI